MAAVIGFGWKPPGGGGVERSETGGVGDGPPKRFASGRSPAREP